MKELNSMTAGSKETGFKLNTEKFLEKGIVKLNNKNCIEKESFMGGGTVWVEVTGRGENCDNVIGASGQFSCSVVSDSLQPHGLQHARPPCPSPTPGACSNSCSSSWWCHLTLSSSVALFSSYRQHFPASGSFPMSQFFASGGHSIGSFSFSISPSNEHPGLISFRMDCLDLLADQGTLKSSPSPQFKSIHSLVLSFLHSRTLTSIRDHRKNHSLD